MTIHYILLILILIDFHISSFGNKETKVKT